MVRPRHDTAIPKETTCNIIKLRDPGWQSPYWVASSEHPKLTVIFGGIFAFLLRLHPTVQHLDLDRKRSTVLNLISRLRRVHGMLTCTATRNTNHVKERTLIPLFKGTVLAHVIHTMVNGEVGVWHEYMP